MAYQSVIVHDIDYLEAFGQGLCQRGQDLAAQYDALLGSVADQESNWQDPQYRDLRQRVENYAAGARSQLEELESAGAYIAALVPPLREL